MKIAQLIRLLIFRGKPSVFLGGVALDYQMGVSPRTIALRVLCALNGLSTGAMCFGVETARLEEYAPY
jgi:hypothetical protein